MSTHSYIDYLSTKALDRGRVVLYDPHTAEARVGVRIDPSNTITRDTEDAARKMGKDYVAAVRWVLRNHGTGKTLAESVALLGEARAISPKTAAKYSQRLKRIFKGRE